MCAGRTAHSPIDEPAPFSFEELFFSRTDTRGIMLAGNSVFQRISMYEWEELLGKPHNLIRHPDMPKAVFYLLWDTIKKGEPIGAYVKNMAKDGRYYWVFALVTPIDGGYLSVRLKPSSEILAVVEREYKSLVAHERNSGISPAESAGLLLARLTELGFSDYGAFTAAALSAEIAARNEQLGRGRDAAVAYFADLTQAARALFEKSGIIFSAYEANKYVPLNLQVQSAQLGDDGAAIAVISSNYNIISTEIKNNMSHFLTSVQKVFQTINAGLLLVSTAKIQQEVIEFFRHEVPSQHIVREQEMTHLERQQIEYRLKAEEGLRDILSQTERFQSACRDMKMLASGLEVTRIMGKVENARQTESGDGLNEMINDLGALQESISTSLREIGQINSAIKFSTERLVEAVRAAA